jgi:hypothetical protein
MVSSTLILKVVTGTLCVGSNLGLQFAVRGRNTLKLDESGGEIVK